MAMEYFNLNSNAEYRLSELACLVDAIPSRFRAPVMAAALQTLPTVDWHQSPLVLSLRSQLQDCADDCVGFAISENVWQNGDLSGLQPACRRLSRCSDPAQVQLVISQLVLQLAGMLLSATREVRS
jgi:hypothetical protein